MSLSFSLPKEFKEPEATPERYNHVKAAGKPLFSGPVRQNKRIYNARIQ